MSRISVQPEWTAEYSVDRDGDVTLTGIECDGEGVQWPTLPVCIDRMLCSAALAAESQRQRDLPGEIADMRLHERRDEMRSEEAKCDCPDTADCKCCGGREPKP